jgi:ABC-type antimicrobial peptide transport system permease subunit
VLSYQVAERSRDFGFRRALGAGETRIVWAVLSQGLWLALLGVSIGVIGSLWTGRALESLLFGVSPVHAPTLLSVVPALLGAAALAGIRPAVRAVRADPMAALRSE